MSSPISFAPQVPLPRSSASRLADLAGRSSADQCALPRYRRGCSRPSAGAGRISRRARPGVDSLLRALDARDHYTWSHSLRVGDLAAAIAMAIGLEGETVGLIKLASLVHDIGKIGVPDHVLLKPGPLNPAESDLMREHPETGVRILAPLFGDATELFTIVRHHHERVDGGGFPDGLRGSSIPVGSRIIAVADTFDAMVSERPYRPSRDWALAVHEILKNADEQLDARCIDGFLAVIAIETARPTREHASREFRKRVSFLPDPGNSGKRLSIGRRRGSPLQGL